MNYSNESMIPPEGLGIRSVGLGDDNERHALSMFGDAWCEIEGTFINTGEPDVTCPECIQSMREE